MIGGRVGNHPGAVTNKVWKYNLNTEKWSAGPALPVPVAAGGAALVDNKIYWFGGLDRNAQCDVDNHYVYDLGNPGAGWKDISGTAPMPRPRNHFATVVASISSENQTYVNSKGKFRIELSLSVKAAESGFFFQR